MAWEYRIQFGSDGRSRLVPELCRECVTLHVNEPVGNAIPNNTLC